MNDGPDDHYAVLGVPKDGSAEEIKRAFRRRARECHPDQGGAAEEFKRVKAAYDVLSDPEQRARYDRSRAWRPSPRPGFAERAARGGRPSDLDDIFGFGGPRPRSQPVPTPGRDVAVAVDVHAGIALTGGTVTVSYQRLRKLDGGEVLARYDEIHELRVPPGTKTGDTLRVPRMGDAGTNGGTPGDLVVDVRVVGTAREGHGPAPQVREVDISVAEAILGGRVPVETAAGPVVVTVPAGTSSGTKFRIRGRGPGGGDVEVAVRIVVPETIDEESRKLIQRFAQLNPTR